MMDGCPAWRPGVLLLTLTLFGCAGEAERADRSTTPSDGSLAGETLNSCSPTGTASGCNPVSLSGCGLGACYVVKALGPACVCPTGSAALGASCNTTPDCLPGHVCAGQTAPGTCRRTCNPAAPDCPSPEACTIITALPAHGYCEP